MPAVGGQRLRGDALADALVGADHEVVTAALGNRTSTISSAITPLCVAAAARWCERAANASWSARLTCWSPRLPSSVSAPIAWSVNASHSPS